MVACTSIEFIRFAYSDRSLSEATVSNAGSPCHHGGRAGMVSLVMVTFADHEVGVNSHRMQMNVTQ